LKSRVYNSLTGIELAVVTYFSPTITTNSSVKRNYYLIKFIVLHHIRYHNTCAVWFIVITEFMLLILCGCSWWLILVFTSWRRHRWTQERCHSLRQWLAWLLTTTFTASFLLSWLLSLTRSEHQMNRRSVYTV